MSLETYQRSLNNLDRDIAVLEKKKLVLREKLLKKLERL